MRAPEEDEGAACPWGRAGPGAGAGEVDGVVGVFGNATAGAPRGRQRVCAAVKELHQVWDAETVALEKDLVRDELPAGARGAYSQAELPMRAVPATPSAETACRQEAE